MGKKDRKPLAPVVESTTKSLSEQELVAQARELSAKKRNDFVREYNALCEKYGMIIEPKIQLEVKLKK